MRLLAGTVRQLQSCEPINQTALTQCKGEVERVGAPRCLLASDPDAPRWHLGPRLDYPMDVQPRGALIKLLYVYTYIYIYMYMYIRIYYIHL